jgi:hypothetical protein
MANTKKTQLNMETKDKTIKRKKIDVLFPFGLNSAS